jgi:hypothetical protein
MPVYQIMGRNGKLYEIEGPPGVTKDQIKAKILARAPEAGLPPQEKSAIEDIPVVGGVLSSIADIPLSAVQGLAGTGKTVSDLFGADNAVSDVLGGIAEGAGRLKSTGSKEDAAISAAEQKSAEDKGVLEQIKAAGRAFGRAPLETTASVVGSAVPFIAAGMAGGIPAAAVLGAASGVGMIKGDIYDAVQEEFTKAGANPEQAQAAAERAQEYSGENLDQQALGGALGALAAATGFAPAIANRLGGRVAAQAAARAAAREAVEKAAPGLARTALTGAAVEAAPEALQAGQERAAQNIALQREGFDVDTMKGVAGQAAFEGIASLIPGAAGKVYATAPQRAADRAAPPPIPLEETPELDIPATTKVDPEVTLARLSEAAGPTSSPGARTAVEALNRRVSNDLSLRTSESLDASRAFITAREDDIAAGTLPPDIAEPYANALAEARRMLEEVVPATTQAGVDVEAGAGLDGGAGRPDLDVVGAAKPSVPDTGVTAPAEEVAGGPAPAEPIGVAGTGEPVGDITGAETGADSALTEEVAPEKRTAIIVHGGSDFEAIDPKYFGTGEPGGIRPLGKGLYGYVVDSSDPEQIAKAVDYARHYAEKYGRGKKTIHAFQLDLTDTNVGFNGPVIEELRGRVGPELQRFYGAVDRRDAAMPGSPERSAAQAEVSSAMDALQKIQDARVERLPIGLTEVGVTNTGKLTRIGKIGVDQSDQELVDVIRSALTTRAPTVDLLAPIKAAPNMVERKKVARPLVSNAVDELVGDVLVPSKVLTSITNVVSQEAAKPNAQFDLKARVGELLAKNGVEVRAAAAPVQEAAPEIDVATPEAILADAQGAVDAGYIKPGMFDLVQAAVNKGVDPQLIRVDLDRLINRATTRVFAGNETPTTVSPGEQVNAEEAVTVAPEAVTLPEPTPVPPVDAVPPAPPITPPPVGAEPSVAAPEPVDITPPAPPITPPPVGAEPSAAAPEPTPPPARTELKTPNKWLVKLADRFGMSAPLDTFVKANLGYESLPEALETTSKLELSTSQQAGKGRNLQRNFFDPIVDQAANLQADLGDIGYFLWARSAADRNRQVAELNPQEFPEGGSGLTTAQAAAGLQTLKDEGKLPALNLLARKVDELVDFNLAEDVKAGLFSQEQAEQLRKAQPFYVPLKGFAKDGDMLTADVDEEADAPTRQAEATRAIQSAAPTGSVQEFRKAFGRGSMPFHPLFNLFQDSETRVRRRLVNTALLPTLRAYKQNPSTFEGILNVYSENNPKKVRVSRDIPGGRWEAAPGGMEQEYYRNRDKYMVVKENGVPHYIEFADAGPGAELKRMFANMSPKDLEGGMKVAANVNNFMKGMLTYKNPLYLLTVAPLRDTSAAIATALANQNIKTSPAYKKNLAAKTFFQILNPSTGMAVARYVFGKAPMNTPTGQLLQEMIAAGGTPLQSRFMNVQEKAGATARAIKTMQGVENLSPKERAANLLDGLNRWVDGLADVMDMNARFATYRAATELGIQSTDAARLALDSSLNLTRRGEMARSLDLILPFFGAGVEGGRKTARILANPKALTKVFGSLIVLGVMESLWNAGQSGDNDDDGREDYLDQDLGAGMRLSRLIIYHGSGPDDYIKIPVDPMLGYFKFVGNKIGDLMAGTAVPAEATNGLLTGFARMMSPLRVPGTDVQSLATAVTPLIGKPFAENIFNENFFGSPIASEAYPGGAPRSELGRASTGDFWKGLAKVVNEITGGSEAVSGGADFQPEMYRHVIEGYFGGPYQLAKQMVGLKEAEGMADVPGIKSFVGTGSEYAPQSKYFENSATLRQIMNRLSKLTPEQQARQGEKYFVDTDPRVMDTFRAVEANLDRINKEQKASMALAQSDADEQLVLDYYRDQKNNYYSAFNSIFNTVKRGE